MLLPPTEETRAFDIFTVREDAAREVVAKRLLDVARQSTRVMLLGVIEEGLEVVANEGMETVSVGRRGR